MGKTWLMLEFGRQFYRQTAYSSFYNNAAEDTLIIFDEVQNAPKAFESLKYFLRGRSGW